MAEPRLEDLSAYLDQELTGAARQEIEGHLEGCETCRRRLQALRQTVSSVRELPVEAPPRPFTIPALREQPRSSGVILGWLGGAAAAALLGVAVLAGLHNLHGPTGGASTPAYSLSQSQAKSGGGVAAPVAAPDQAFRSLGLPYAHGAAAVSDPRNPARRLELASDSGAYGRGGTIRVEVVLGGSPVAGADAARTGLQLSLQRNGAGTVLAAPTLLASSSGAPIFTGAYPVSQLSLPQGSGAYTLVATWTIPDASGTILTAQLPVQIES